MAALTTQERAEVHRDYMRDEHETFGAVTKLNLRAAVDALDDFFESNAAAINAAIPQPARGQLSTAQKSRLVRHVLRRRYG